MECTTYPAAVLKAAVPLFDGKPVRAHPYCVQGRPQVKEGVPIFQHLPEAEAHMAPWLVREQIGTISGPWWHEGAILGRLHLLPACELTDDVVHGYGLSMQLGALVNHDAEGRPVDVARITEAISLDLAHSPALGGRILGPWISRTEAEKWHNAERAMVRFEEATQRAGEVERRQAILRRYEERMDAVVSRYEARMHALAERAPHV